MTQPLVEPEPPSVAAIFGDRLELVQAFAGHLAERGEEAGVIGPRELGRLWSRHIVNCALVAPLLRPGTTGDVGSGAGLPGIVLAIARPDVHLVLIEPMERRVGWLRREAHELALDNVTILRSRAQDAALGRKLDQVTARAVSALSSLIPAAAPLVRHGGEMLFMKGARVADEVTAAAAQIRSAGLTNIEIVELRDGTSGEATKVFRATVD